MYTLITVMEHRPNSVPDTGRMNGHVCSQRYRALIYLDGPQLPMFRSFDARLRTFDKDWPYKHHPNLVDFSAADFLHGYGTKHLSCRKRYSSYITHVYTYLSLIIGVYEKTVGLRCWGCLKD
jgi:hypothetical protein